MNRPLCIVLFLFLSCAFAQQKDLIEFKHIRAKITLNPFLGDRIVSHTYSIDFDILRPVDSMYLDAVNMKFDHILLNDVPVKFKNDNEKLIIYKRFNSGESYRLSFNFSHSPKKALYALGWDTDARNQIWTQGQGKNTSHWLPSIDDPTAKMEFDLIFLAPQGYEVISNGVLKSKTMSNGLVRWAYDMINPMSSYLVAVVVGNYRKRQLRSKRGTPLLLYHYPEDTLKVESTYRYSQQMFEFLETEIGVNYPWQNYKQVPVHDFLYAGMENTSCTIFSDAYVVDSIGFNDKSYTNVNAHELAHQWFGNLVTAKSGAHHWLQEGFATYYALLAERHIFGDNHFYFNLLESALDLRQQELTGNGTSLLNPKSSSLTFYQRGAWVLHALRTVVGDTIFRRAVVNYLDKFRFNSAETSDFIEEVERLYGKSMSGFVNLWIVQKEFPVDNALDILKSQSTYINAYLMIDCEVKSSKCANYLKYYASDEAKAKIISQVPSLITKEVFINNLKVRQAISKHLTNIPLDLKEVYETLLDDKSYITIEHALYNLWTNFPEDRAKYLSKTREIIGFNDKNVRLLWIVLNLNTPLYQANNKQVLYNELVSYTDEKYNADLRMNAFQYLGLIKSCNSVCRSNLKKAKTHHNWRLVKFARQFEMQLQSP